MLVARAVVKAGPDGQIEVGPEGLAAGELEKAGQGVQIEAGQAELAAGELQAGGPRGGRKLPLPKTN